MNNWQQTLTTGWSWTHSPGERDVSGTQRTSITSRYSFIQLLIYGSKHFFRVEDAKIKENRSVPFGVCQKSDRNSRLLW